MVSEDSNDADSCGHHRASIIPAHDPKVAEALAESGRRVGASRNWQLMLRHDGACNHARRTQKKPPAVH